MRFRRLLVVACIALAGSPAFGGDWGTLMSREEALAQLDSPDSRDRREGLGRLAEVGANEDVPYMMQLLHDVDPMVRGMAEQALWGLWLRANDRGVNSLLQNSIVMIQQKDIEQAIEKLDEIIAYKPEFAEAWNRRGDAYSHLGELDHALADYEEAIRLNPYHFGAMQSCGEIWLERADARRSAAYFRRALDLNPNLYEVAVILRTLEQELENDRI
ncbi:MAG: tetratricopeptide repeat protein [Betaproteobacteria bacterium]|nr:MAG: tetratricopeptide repeat protein [Betaproteobacteria bacterium]